MCVKRFGSKDIVPVLGEMTIRFLAPAISDLVVEVHVTDEDWEKIEHETRTSGKFKYVKNIEVKDTTGKTNAVASATYFMLIARN